MEIAYFIFPEIKFSRQIDIDKVVGDNVKINIKSGLKVTVNCVALD